MTPTNLAKLINRHGKTLTLTKKTTSGTYDPASGTFSGDADTEYTIKGYFYTDKVGTLGEVAYGKRMVAISGSVSSTPAQGDYLSGSGDDVRVGPVRSISSGDAVIVYLCEVEE